jgi:hypothetical protein
MTITRKLTSMTTAVAIAASALGGMATSASAKDWDGHRDGYRYSRSYDRHDDRGWRRHNRDRYYARHYRRDNTGKYIALGVGALMLGIIASEASRH